MHFQHLCKQSNVHLMKCSICSFHFPYRMILHLEQTEVNELYYITQVVVLRRKTKCLLYIDYQQLPNSLLSPLKIYIKYISPTFLPSLDTQLAGATPHRHVYYAISHEPTDPLLFPTNQQKLLNQPTTVQRHFTSLE